MAPPNIYGALEDGEATTFSIPTAAHFSVSPVPPVSGSRRRQAAAGVALGFIALGLLAVVQSPSSRSSSAAAPALAPEMATSLGAAAAAGPAPQAPGRQADLEAEGGAPAIEKPIAPEVVEAAGSEGAFPEAPKAPDSADQDSSSDSTDSSTPENGWYIYKVAYPAPEAERENVLSFMETYSKADSCESISLGCSSYKLNCDLRGSTDAADRQLHYVVAPIFESKAEDDDDLGVDGWTELVMKDLGDMSSFSTMVHQKMSIFINDVVTQAQDLEAGGFNVMRRQSTATDGSLLGHVLVPVSGAVWEFVGFLEQSYETSAAAAEAGYTMWVDEECPDAHKFNGELAKYRAAFESSSDSLFVGISTPVSNLKSKDFQLMMGHLQSATDAVIETKSTDYCSVMSFHFKNDESYTWGNYGEETITTRYVQNFRYQEINGDKTVADFEKYVSRVHDKYLSRPEDKDIEDRWRNWDHWLDAHVGIKYKSSDGCVAKAIKLNKLLIDDDINVGKRLVTYDGDHYYSGYKGAFMALEFNTECHYGTASDLCGCTAMNNYFLAEEEGTADELCEYVHYLDASYRLDEEDASSSEDSTIST
uniref:Uncharacterized protein n=1 Tax=Rhizochromulina marina TaxID=1034831 RepID=A0A7S2RRD5_9STRA|mmetsp:Transcript_19433/g.56646  ORF Transcript_19433/g.56646 Transcript_19433/m.56646 type:complete len:591 (+) Transcript_19433:26-1798(+)